MLHPEESRRLYSACFKPPSNHVFEAGVGTTFTLDLETLFFVPLGLRGHSFDDPAAAVGDLPAMLEAIHGVSESLTVFCQDGYANAPLLHEPLLSLLEECLIPARARGDGAIFHPKLWLFRFRSLEDDTRLLRAIILSRNITASRCWDSMVQLEGTVSKQKRKENDGLATLIRALPQLASRPSLLNDARKTRLLELADQVDRTEFIVPAPFSKISFLTLGTGDSAKWEPSSGTRLLGVSPFLGGDALRVLGKLAKKRMLISREESLEACERDPLEGWECLALRAGAGAEGEVAEVEAFARSAETLPHGLHAKALVIENGSTTTWWLGSGNLTNPVLNGTYVELLVELEGTTRQVGIDRFLDAGFADLLKPFDLSSPVTPPAEDAEARRLCDAARHDIVRSCLSVECERVDEHWSLTVSGPLRVREGVTVEVGPLTLPVGRHQEWKGDALSFTALSPELLTAFITFRVTASANAEEVTEEFTCRLPASGFPPEREQRIVRSIISDRKKLLSYLDRLLGDPDSWALSPEPKTRAGRSRSGDGATTTADGQVLLENLLRAVRRNPARLVAFDRLIERLRLEANDDTEGIVPPDLLELWQVVREVLPQGVES